MWVYMCTVQLPAGVAVTILRVCSYMYLSTCEYHYKGCDPPQRVVTNSTIHSSSLLCRYVSKESKQLGAHLKQLKCYELYHSETHSIISLKSVFMLLQTCGSTESTNTCKR